MLLFECIDKSFIDGNNYVNAHCPLEVGEDKIFAESSE